MTRTKCGGALAGVLGCVLLAILGLCTVLTEGWAQAPRDPKSRYRSPCALAADAEGKRLFVAEAGVGRIAVVDLDTGKVAGEIDVPGVPLDVVVDEDRNRIYVADGSPAGFVHAVSVADGTVGASIPVGHTPTALALSPDGKTLYACNRFTNDVSVVDTDAGKEVVRIPVQRQPVAAALTPDGSDLVVANHLPAGRGDTGNSAAAVSIISTAQRTARAQVRLLNGSTGLRGVCVSPDGKYAYVTHILARYLIPTTQVDRGWMNTNALSIIDLAQGKLLACVLVDDMDCGAANPWSVTCTPDGNLLLVTHAGTHGLSVIDRLAMHRKIDARLAEAERVQGKVAAGQRTITPIEDDLSFLVNVGRSGVAEHLRRRIRLPGNGPRSVCVVGPKAYIAMYFSDDIAVVNLDPAAVQKPLTFSLGPETQMTLERRGEMLFNDATSCFQHWQSCATCHPDARNDALNWDLLNDGIGNPRQSKSMLLSHRTPPVMVTGVRKDAETAVRAGMKFIEFMVRPEEDSVAVDAYLKPLEPVPSPHLADGKLNESAQRGQKAFLKAGCAQCHPAPLSTDIQKHDVGIGLPHEGARPFDTPTLVEVWRTAPYLMDGRAATMMDVLTTCNKGDKHGMTSGLSKQELQDLAEYVLSR
ncbi:MAG TPA: c-type cytochrome [Planctomycetota bacterium]|nr:c-type cytochrome [Planctomycetota bacterium]